MFSARTLVTTLGRSAARASSRRAFTTTRDLARTSTAALFTRPRAAAAAAAFTVATVSTAALFATVAAAQPEEAAATTEPALSKSGFKPLTLKVILPYNHDSAIYEFEAVGVEGLPTASFVVCKAPGGACQSEDGKDVVRPYTPIENKAKDAVTLLVKAYEQGNLSKYIGNMKVGDTLEMKGPLMKYAVGENQFSHISMVAGGTGITPMLQVIQNVLSNRADTTTLSLVYANKTEADILCKEDLDALKATHGDRFNLHYVVDKPEATPTTSTPVHGGYVSKELLMAVVPPPSTQQIVYVCGPPGFYNHVCGGKTPDYKQGDITGLLGELGYDNDTCFKF